MECNKCGRCCKVLLIKIKKQDKDMAELSRLRNIKILDLDKTTSAMLLENIPCRYLSKSNLCTIYRQRPSLCKNYPTKEDIILDGCSMSNK